MNAKQIIAYMDSQPLVHALMWFIEHISDDTLPQTERSEVFFALRSRYYKEAQA